MEPEILISSSNLSLKQVVLFANKKIGFYINEKTTERIKEYRKNLIEKWCETCNNSGGKEFDIKQFIYNDNINLNQFSGEDNDSGVSKEDKMRVSNDELINNGNESSSINKNNSSNNSNNNNNSGSMEQQHEHFKLLQQQLSNNSQLNGSILIPNQLNENLVIENSSVVSNEYLPDKIVRAALLIQLNLLFSGTSGVSLKTLDILVRRLKEDNLPLVLDGGSLGISDSIPLSQASLGLFGKSIPLPNGKIPQVSMISDDFYGIINYTNNNNNNNSTNNKNSNSSSFNDYYNDECSTSLKDNNTNNNNNNSDIDLDIINNTNNNLKNSQNNNNNNNNNNTTNHQQLSDNNLNKYILDQLIYQESNSIINSNCITLASGALLLHDISCFLNGLDTSASFSLEAFRANLSSLNSIVSKFHNHSGQVQCSNNFQNILNFSKLWEQTQETQYIQDPLSFRSVSQIHGASYSAFEWCYNIFEKEINLSVDNPLILTNENNGSPISNGNSDTGLLSLSMDTLRQSISRSIQILGQRISKLPWNHFSNLQKRISPSSTSTPLPIDKSQHTQIMTLVKIAASIISNIQHLANPVLNLYPGIQLSDGFEDTAPLTPLSIKNTRLLIEEGWKLITIEIIISIYCIKQRNIPVSSIGFGLRSLFNSIIPLLPLFGNVSNSPSILDTRNIQEFIKNYISDNH